MNLGELLAAKERGEEVEILTDAAEGAPEEEPAPEETEEEEGDAVSEEEDEPEKEAAAGDGKPAEKKDAAPEKSEAELRIEALEAKLEAMSVKNERDRYKYDRQAEELGDLRKQRTSPPRRARAEEDEEPEEELDDTRRRSPRDREVEELRRERGEAMRDRIEAAVEHEFMTLEDRFPGQADKYKDELSVLAQDPRYRLAIKEAREARSPKEARELVRLAGRELLADAKELSIKKQADAARSRTKDQAAKLVKDKKAATPIAPGKVASSVADATPRRKVDPRFRVAGDPAQIAKQLARSDPRWR